MAETTEKILSSSEKEMPRKPDQNINEKYIQRIITKNRDGAVYKTVSDIIQTKIKKNLPEAVIEHMKWEKFGIPAGQPRGSLEPGIIEISNEVIHIQDRDNSVEQDIGDKIRDSIKNKRNIVLKEMQEKKDRENMEKLNAFKNVNTNQKEKREPRKNKEGTIKITGFNPNMTVQDIVDLFSKAGPVRKCVVPSKNVAYLEYLQKEHAEKSFEMFNDVIHRNSILSVQILSN